MSESLLRLPHRKRILTLIQKVAAAEAVRRYQARNQDKIRAYKKLYNQTHREERAASFRKYKANHKEKCSAYNKKYRQEHRDEIEAKRKIYVAATKEKRRSQRAIYNRTHAADIEARRKARYAADPEKYKARMALYKKANSGRAKDYYLKHHYGISLEQYRAILEAQGGACKICSATFDTAKLKPHIDHNHDTGKVRGLLCNCCNIAVGMIKENIPAAMALVAYLENDRREDVPKSTV
jgi:hypothetical protein